MADTKHTVGATIGNLRVPQAYEAELEDLAQYLTPETTEMILGRVASMLSRAVTTEMGGESHDRGIFNLDSPNFEKRYQPDYGVVGRFSETMKSIGQPVVLTSGTYDLLHVGHARYLSTAKEKGDFLIVGVDSDEKVRRSKGPHRPIVPEQERLRMLSHLRGVDLITLKPASDERWKLIKTVRPNTLIATEGTYSDKEVEELEANWVDRVVVLPPQAERSTSALVRLSNIAAKEFIRDQIKAMLVKNFPHLPSEEIEAMASEASTHPNA